MDYAHLMQEENRLINLLNEPYILMDSRKESIVVDALNDIQAKIFDLQEDCIRSYGYNLMKGAI